MASARTVLVLAAATLLAGLALLVLAGMRGEAELHLVVVIPVVSGTGALFGLGVLLFMAGFVLLFLGMSMRAATAVEGPPPERPTPPAPSRVPSQEAPPPAGRAEWGGVVFIGPVPIAFGSSPRMGRWMVLAAVVMGVLLLVFILGVLL